jgi:hypothetical protein
MVELVNDERPVLLVVGNYEKVVWWKVSVTSNVHVALDEVYDVALTFKLLLKNLKDNLLSSLEVFFSHLLEVVETHDFHEPASESFVEAHLPHEVLAHLFPARELLFKFYSTHQVTDFLRSIHAHESINRRQQPVSKQALHD